MLLWLAAAWAVLFALPSFYWAAGGDFASETIAADVDEALGAAASPVALAATGAVKLLAGALVLSLLPGLPIDPPLGRRRVALLVAILGGGFLLYATANLIDHGLMLAGVREVPGAIGESAVRWHFLFWDPWWLAGGALFLAAGLRARREAR